MERWLGGNASKHALAIVPKASPEPPRQTLPEDVVPPPSILTDEETPYWNLWAPLATRRGTLNPDTAPGFVELCQVARRKAWIWSDILGRGLVYEKVTIDGAGQEHREFKKHPLLTEWRGLTKQVELLHARFGLTGDGKVPEQKPDADQEEAALAQLLAVK